MSFIPEMQYKKAKTFLKKNGDYSVYLAKMEKREFVRKEHLDRGLMDAAANGIGLSVYLFQCKEDVFDLKDLKNVVKGEKYRVVDDE